MATSAFDPQRGKPMAAGLSLAELSRAWQMLLKGLDELRIAPSPLLAAEMLIVRLGCAADLPSAEKLLALLGAAPDPYRPDPTGHDSTGAPSQASLSPAVGAAPVLHAAIKPPPVASAAMAIDGTMALAGVQQLQGSSAQVRSFAEVVALFQRHKKPLLYSWLHSRARLVSFEEGRIELERGDNLLAERRQEMSALLQKWTDRPWQISESGQPGMPSLTDQEASAKRARLDELAGDPRVKPVLEAFPGARIVDVQACPVEESGRNQQTARND